MSARVLARSGCGFPFSRDVWDWHVNLCGIRAAKEGSVETGKADQGRRILGDLSIGALAGVDQVLMCLAFTAMLFGGALASFAGPALILFLVGNAIIALTVTLISGLPINLATAQEKAPAISSH